ncbi:MAG: hypothetical protein H7835_07335 [Magnetococcus sp. XQGC-1]
MEETNPPSQLAAVAEYIMAELHRGIAEEEIQQALLSRGISGDLVGQIKKIFDFAMSQIDKNIDGIQRKNLCTHLTSLNLEEALVKAIVDRVCTYRLQEMNAKALQYDLFAKSQTASDMQTALQEMLERTGHLGSTAAADPLPPPAKQRKPGMVQKIWQWMGQK